MRESCFSPGLETTSIVFLQFKESVDAVPDASLAVHLGWDIQGLQFALITEVFLPSQKRLSHLF